MARNSSQVGWWRRGNLRPRALWLGVILGVVGSIIYFLSLGWGKPVRLGELVWALFAFFFIAVAAAALGLFVAGIVTGFQRMVPETSSRSRRAMLTGGVATVASFVATIILFSALPLVLHADRWATAVITGIFGGAAFAALSYWRTTES